MRLVALLLLCVLAQGQDAHPHPPLPRGYWVNAEVTAYCPCAKCTDGDKKTANNTSTDAVPYNFAADRSLRMGTRIYVQPGLDVLDNVRANDRIFTVDDRGGALDTEAEEYKEETGKALLRLDLRVMEHWYARKFGRRMLWVYVITEKVRK